MKTSRESQWAGRFAFRECRSAFMGRSSANSLHEHASIQLCVARAGTVTVLDTAGRAHRASGLLIGSGVAHALQPCEQVTLVFSEPQTPLSRALSATTNGSEIAALPMDLTEKIRAASSPEDCLQALDEFCPSQPDALDPRVHDALDWLVTADYPDAIARAAAHCGLSDSRLRVLVRRHLGTSLSRWLTWRKLEFSARSLMAGSTLADAALAGGFSDQAHFCRQMRAVLGITPRTASGILRES